MPIFNSAQAQYFIELLTGGDSSLLTWQIYYDPKDGTERKDLAKWFNADLKNCNAAFEQAEVNLCGVYLCINEMDGNGRNAFNTKRIRALFADFDGCEEPNWPLTPHFVTKRDDTHGHAFWLVDNIEVDQFMFLQMRIALICGTDKQVIDPSRVARLPGTGHFKDPENPKSYHVAWDNTQVVSKNAYTLDDIYSAFDLTGDALREYEKWVDSRTNFDEGSGFEDSETYINKFKKIVENCKPAEDGEGGSHQLFSTAAFGFDYGITLSTATDILWEYYNPRCIPPWGDDEKDHFELVVSRAYKYAKNAPGCRTAAANFDAVPPPPPKPLPKTVTREGDRLDEAEGAIISPMMNGKTSRYELAQCYDGVMYNGVNIIRFRKMFYRFNGRSWSIVDDDVIKSSIQKFYSHLKPSDSLVRETLSCFKDLVTTDLDELDNGTWLDSGVEADNVLCFKNSLVDVGATTPLMIEHTPNFFTFNELEYDYKNGGECPKFLKFLSEVWPNDPEIILQLQEFMGYCLVSDVSLQKFAIFIGKSRSGKGVLTHVISQMIGAKNTVAPALSKLTTDSTLHNMSKARLALIPDAHSVNVSKRDEVLSLLKAVTGCDPIDYHVMYKGTQTSLFKLKFILSTNNMPEFIDASGALVNRMLVFPFQISFQGRENPNLKNDLMEEISAIAQWALTGLRRLRSNNGKFTEAECGISEKENIKDDMNPLGRFIEDVCVVERGEFVCIERLYEIYLLWCKQHKVTLPLSQNKITRLLKATDMPISQKRLRVDGKRKIGFQGLNVVAFPGVEEITDTNI